MVKGRPRSFDIDEALDQALNVFWSKGYEGTSLSDLTSAMGINRPSLYAAFGNKEELFKKALERYADKACFIRDALAQKSIKVVLEKLLTETAEALSDPESPRGCLAVQGALTCGEEAEAVRQALISLRASGEKKLRERISQAKKDGQLKDNIKPADLARYICTVTQGMSVQATGGATRKELREVARLTISSLSQHFR